MLELINDIEKDTNRTRLIELQKEIVKLNIDLSNDREQYSKIDGVIKIKTIELKDKYRNEAKENNIKITVDELENKVEMDLKDMIETKVGLKGSIDKLDTLTKAYQEFINTIKFVDRKMIQSDNLMSNVTKYENY